METRRWAHVVAEVEGYGEQRFQRYVDPQLEICRPPNLAHAASTEKRTHPVPLAQDLTRGEGLPRVGQRGFFIRVFELVEQ